jgi:hypothetical protein
MNLESLAIPEGAVRLPAIASEGLGHREVLMELRPAYRLPRRLPIAEWDFMQTADPRCPVGTYVPGRAAYDIGSPKSDCCLPNR